MADESFAHPLVAAEMNANYVCIKVDREERPDIDAIYMAATVAMTGNGGWPMTCFLTAEQEPFYCGMYFPPDRRNGTPSFREVLAAVTTTWRTRRAEVHGVSGKVREQLTKMSEPLPVGKSLTEAAELVTVVTEKIFADAVKSLAASVDITHGGYGRAPKFPPSTILTFLLTRYETSREAADLASAERTLLAMAQGGIYDQLAGGFSRYSVDNAWEVPHFEKMLYDNALLLAVYSQAFVITRNEFYRRIARETATFIISGLSQPAGGFASSFDADTPVEIAGKVSGVEGLTYVWTVAELHKILGPVDGEWAAGIFGVTEQGNFENSSATLQLAILPTDEIRFNKVRTTLLAARKLRPQPKIDKKVITMWNALAISALVEAGNILGCSEFLETAQSAADALLEIQVKNSRVYRSAIDGAVGTVPGFLEDYAALTVALLAIYQINCETKWLTRAIEILETAITLFGSPEVGWFDTGDTAEALLVRPRDLVENATPTGNSLMAKALVRAAQLTENSKDAVRYRKLFGETLNAGAIIMETSPRAAGHWLTVLAQSVGTEWEIAISVGSESTEELVKIAYNCAPSWSIIVRGKEDQAALLRNRPPIDGVDTAYLCVNRVCHPPITDPVLLRQKIIELLIN